MQIAQRAAVMDGVGGRGRGERLEGESLDLRTTIDWVCVSVNGRCPNRAVTSATPTFI